MEITFDLLPRQMHGGFCGHCPFLSFRTSTNITVICRALHAELDWYDGPIARCQGNPKFGKKL